MNSREELLTLIFALSCQEQFDLATKIAANVGYMLIGEPSLDETADEAERKRIASKLSHPAQRPLDQNRIADIIGWYMASLVAGNNQPDMGGDPRNRIPAGARRRHFDDACQAAAQAVITTVTSTERASLQEPRFQTLRARLLRSITTATNDDCSEPMSDKRDRHCDRIASMYVAIDFIDATLSSPADDCDGG
jgi:hypothetical protein